MKNKFEVTLEIVRFECTDIIATSDHNNSYVDEGFLPYLIEDIKSNIKKIF